MRFICHLGAVLVAATTACGEHTASFPTAPVAFDDLAVLEISALSPPVGTRVAVTARVRHREGAEVGSFVSRLVYPAEGLRLLQVRTGAGVAGAVNSASIDTIAVAGAAPTGLPMGEMFTAFFEVRRSDALAQVKLRVAELTGVDWNNRLAGLVTAVRPQLASAPLP